MQSCVDREDFGNMHSASLRLFRGLRIIKCLLPLPVVPVERAGDAVDPVFLLPVEW
jgi:hypothetical protein